ncbi:ACT domain-containing protein [Enterocloster sp. OA13]|uniref:ACT domain-containing protein n=1 Tax=Enterocloster sp. OA13 TaxID=2914161 RepID=UPI00046EC0E8|nr:ACT domain-containing protein [Enterocloster sp. OA13]
MEIKRIEYNFSVCKVADYSLVKLDSEYSFIGKTDEERSLVCMTEDVPLNVTERDDGWRAFRIQGVLDFSLIGILSEISGILAENKIGIFAISTFNTDYVLTKKENYQRALDVLDRAGYKIVGDKSNV